MLKQRHWWLSLMQYTILRLRQTLEDLSTSSPSQQKTFESLNSFQWGERHLFSIRTEFIWTHHTHSNPTCKDTLHHKRLDWKSNLPCDRKESTSTGPTKFEVQIVAQFDNHNSQVWRVSWNITSTLLASSGDDGCVRLWKGRRIC